MQQLLHSQPVCSSPPKKKNKNDKKNFWSGDRINLMLTFSGTSHDVYFSTLNNEKRF